MNGSLGPVSSIPSTTTTTTTTTKKTAATITTSSTSTSPSTTSSTTTANTITTKTPTSPNSVPASSKGTRPRRTEDWNVHRDKIESLYRDRQMKLRDVKRIMEEEFSFTASYSLPFPSPTSAPQYFHHPFNTVSLAVFTPSSSSSCAKQKQYKDRLASWNVRKNIKAKEVHIMLRKQQRRAAEGKRTAFRVAGQVIEPKRISRFVRRYGTHWEVDEARENIQPGSIHPSVETQPVDQQTQQELHQNLPTSPEPETPTDIEYFTPEPDQRAMTLSPLTETPSRFHDETLEPLPDPEIDHSQPLPVSPSSHEPPKPIASTLPDNDAWKALDVFQGQLLTLSRTLDQSMAKFTSPHDDPPQ
ncbi:Clr5 domain-containing protein [Aspergillus homomorphus CBS 101889]|uniref:Clr5 domain-containing protein n=1 Tax=Aspergillus homomorphus (strain CBS 101889) TaxID=1450537 RepID=A0A395I1I4_ASPHC|nr:hypothetical protein BO97DRAFT_342523 [Aspergillus homomorphus CBS 101889]RAL13549.1 hypothetical protein BO97DRAFT_342523 [Aspergillus homomorphus CBS 101889]